MQIDTTANPNKLTLHRVVNNEIQNGIANIVKDIYVRIQFTFDTLFGASIQYPDYALKLPSAAKIIAQSVREQFTSPQTADYKLNIELLTAEGAPVTEMMELYFVTNRIEKYPQTPFCIVKFLRAPSKLNTTHFILSVSIQSSHEPISFDAQQNINFRSRKDPKRAAPITDPLPAEKQQKTVHLLDLTLIPSNNPVPVKVVYINCTVSNWKKSTSAWVLWDRWAILDVIHHDDGVILILPHGQPGTSVAVVICSGSNEILTTPAIFTYDADAYQSRSWSEVGQLGSGKDQTDSGYFNFGNGPTTFDQISFPNTEPSNGKLEEEVQVLFMDFHMTMDMKLKEQAHEVIPEDSVVDFLNIEKLKYDATKPVCKGFLGNYVEGNCGNQLVSVYLIKVRLENEKNVEEFERDAKVICSIRHPNVARYLGYSPSYPYLVMEPVVNKTLYERIHAYMSDIPVSTIIDILHNIATAVSYLHSLNEENTNFLSLTSKRVLFDAKMRVKVFDFGLVQTKQLDLSLSSKSVFDNVAWYAPEYLDPKRINERTNKGDIFAFGVIAWELMTRKIPWEGIAQLDAINSLKCGKRENIDAIPKHYPDSLKKLVADCWNDDPNKRPNLSTLNL